MILQDCMNISSEKKTIFAKVRGKHLLHFWQRNNLLLKQSVTQFLEQLFATQFQKQNVAVRYT